MTYIRGLTVPSSKPDSRQAELEVWHWRDTYDLYHEVWIGLTFFASCLLIYPSGQFNSLAPGKFQWNFRQVIFKQILVIDGWSISCEIALIWMTLDFTNDQSTLVAWWHQAITWANVDLVPYRHMASPGPNELIHKRGKYRFLCDFTIFQYGKT